MDIKAYIESGVLEAFVLGSLSGQEEAEVEAEIARYPELVSELNAIELAMFEFAQAHAVPPPAAMQEKVWGLLHDSGGNVGEHNTTAVREARIIPLQPEYRKPAQWRVAAIWLALIGSITANVVMWNDGRVQREDRLAMNVKLEQMQADQKQLAELLNGYEQAKNMMADTAMQTIVMHTMQKGHPMAATLFWHKEKGEAYVAMEALPAPPKGMQYQLWVIQNGKPVDMGVLPNSMANTPAMQKVGKSVSDGEAFAISLEKEGGSPTPTTVYVLGKA